MTEIRYSMKHVVEITGLSQHALRYYENEGLLPGLQRKKNGHRYFEQQDIDWILWVKRLRQSEMSMSEIRRFIDLTREGAHTIDERCDFLSDHREKLRNRINELNDILEMLDQKIGYYYEMQKEMKQNE